MTIKPESKRCPFCMENSLRVIRQTWSFADELAKKIPIIEIEMFCGACEKRSVWRWVAND